MKQMMNSPKQEGDLVDWRKKLISLHLVRISDGICLYSHRFQIGDSSRLESQLFGMGFVAIRNMMRETVDTQAEIYFIDLKNKKVLVEENKTLMAILVVQEDLSVIRDKLIKLITQFERIFGLQQQISKITSVCPEDYALATDLISLIFDNRLHTGLDLIPSIFNSIREKGSTPDPYFKPQIPDEMHSILAPRSANTEEST